MPLSTESHEKRLRDKGVYSEAQIEHTLGRSELYASHNREHPGFFDMMIDSGKLLNGWFHQLLYIGNSALYLLALLTISLCVIQGNLRSLLFE